MPFSRRSDSSARTLDSTYLSTFGWFLPTGRSRLEVGLPQIDVDLLIWLRRLAEHLARVEADAVERLRLLAFAVRVGVGKDVGAVQRVDDAAPAPRVAGKPRVPARVNIPRDHGVAGLEARRRRGGPLRGLSQPPEAGGRSRGQVTDGGGGGRVGPSGEELRAALQLLGRDHALFHEHAGNAVQPVLVVAGPEVVGRIHPLDAVAELVQVVETVAHARAHDGVHYRLPGRVKGGLVRLALHRPEAVHPAEIVDPVHGSARIIGRPPPSRQASPDPAGTSPGAPGPLRCGPSPELPAGRGPFRRVLAPPFPRRAAEARATAVEIVPRLCDS